jgi:hypothetical protein
MAGLVLDTDDDDGQQVALALDRPSYQRTALLG